MRPSRCILVGLCLAVIPCLVSCERGPSSEERERIAELEGRLAKLEADTAAAKLRAEKAEAKLAAAEAEEDQECARTRVQLQLLRAQLDTGLEAGAAGGPRWKAPTQRKRPDCVSGDPLCDTQ